MTRQTRASLAAAALALVTAACGTAQPTVTAIPSAGEASTAASASAELSAPPSGSAVPVPDGELRLVVADALRMRSEPGTGSEPVAGFERGDAVLVVSEPVTADGFAWVEAVGIDGDRGWLATGDGTDAWLVPIPEQPAGNPMLSFEYACDVVGPFNAPSTLIYEDGRVIHAFTDETHGGDLLERRLSAAGIEHLRETIFASPFLQTSGEYTPVPRPGAEPPGHGACSFTFIVATDAAPVEVTSIGWFGDQEESTFYQPSPERKALDGIARNLMAIDTVLAESFWEEADWLPSIPAEHLLWVGPGDFQAPEGTVLVDTTAFGLGDLEAFGEPSGRGRCAIITAEQAFTFARVLNEAGTVHPIRLHIPGSFGFRVDGGWRYYGLLPVTPGAPACDEVSF
jgi:hypothetical protein